jgi:hypothetical protein
MTVRLHPHARARLSERGVDEFEAVSTVESGTRTPAKFGRTRFRQDFAFGSLWRGRRYSTKRVDVVAVEENDGWLILTVIARYY